MKPFDLRFDILILRFYLMMAIIIASFFVGAPYLALLSLPVFFSAIMGVKIFSKNKKKHTHKKLKVVKQETKQTAA